MGLLMSEDTEKFFDMFPRAYFHIIKEFVNFFDPKLAHGTLARVGKKLSFAMLAQFGGEADILTALQTFESTLSERDGNIISLPRCPYYTLAENYKKRFRKSLPSEVEETLKAVNKTGVYAAMIPFCVVHQAFRDAMGVQFGLEVKHLGTKNPETGDIFLAEKNLEVTGVSPDVVKGKLGSAVCVYHMSGFRERDILKKE